jgi:hypothetical protein
MALEDLEEKGSFQKVLGVFVEFLRCWKLWCDRTGALAKFQNFTEIFGGFW